MFDTIPVFVADFLDGAIAWVYSFQPTLEPTVVLGKYCSNSQHHTIIAEHDGDIANIPVLDHRSAFDLEREGGDSFGSPWIRCPNS